MNTLELRRRTLGKGVYKKTVEGNPAIAQGSLARRYLGITMQGWTEQAQYEGENLFDISDFETNNKGTIENGTILFKQNLGTVTYYLSLSPGTYSISIKRSGYSGINIKVNEVAVINNGGGTKLTDNFDVSDGDSVVLEFSEGQNPNGEDRMIYDIMLNSGSTALPYEPYTGGQPSPSPDYPQEIVSAGKYDEGMGKWKYEVKLTGANLFNPDGERVSGLYMGTPLHNKSSVCMQLYEKDPDVDVTGCYIGLSASGIGSEGGLGWALSNGNLNNSGLMVTASMDMYVTWFPVGETILQKIINRYDVMVNIGEQPLPYQPYKEQTVTLTADRPLTKWDKLEKRNGQWGWVYKSAEVVLDGSEDENWNVTASSTYTFTIDINGAMFINSFCDRYICKFGSWASNDFGIYSDNGFATKFFRPPSADVETVEQWKTFLSQNPLTVVCETAEETFVPLSESEQEQMNALHTFRPTTVLSNDCECEMSLTYKTKKSLEVID